jgi:signal transduction histidine kinase/DNA-binding NarL/FixJ family response regulator
MSAAASLSLETRRLVEQLRLVLVNANGSAIPMVLLALVLVWRLSDDTNALALKIWFVCVTSVKLYWVWDARRTLESGTALNRPHRLVWRQVATNAIYGAAWGALPWVALGATTVVGTALVIAAMAGVSGGSLTPLAPVLPVFLVLTSVELLGLLAKLLQLGPDYAPLAIISVLYVGSLLAQARTSSKAARTAIDLRFENIELIERLRVETEYAQAEHQKATQANLAKSKFLAAASHDLRQPIHAQGLFLEILARGELSPSQRDAVANARATWQASSEMLDALLDFSRIEAGVVEPQLRPFHLQPLLKKIEDELAPQADAKGLIYRSRETHAAVLSDPVLIELIVRNLVSNAIRYTTRGGVLVACRKRGADIRLEVWDTGIGIEKSQHEEIFLEFHQLGNPERDRRKGLGLGLPIAQGLARALGHRLWLTSKPGRGSVFSLTMPVSRVAVVASEGFEALPSAVGALKVRVLVIDDDDAVRSGMLQLLRHWGCECDAVGSIEEALTMARARPPGLVVSDYRLREQRTGAEAIAALRAEFGARLPAMLITGDTAPDRLREARAVGVPLLHKPVSPAQLYRRMVSVLDDSAHGHPSRMEVSPSFSAKPVQPEERRAPARDKPI